MPDLISGRPYALNQCGLSTTFNPLIHHPIVISLLDAMNISVNSIYDAGAGLDSSMIISLNHDPLDETYVNLATLSGMARADAQTPEANVDIIEMSKRYMCIHLGNRIMFRISNIYPDGTISLPTMPASLLEAVQEDTLGAKTTSLNDVVLIDCLADFHLEINDIIKRIDDGIDIEIAPIFCLSGQFKHDRHKL